MTLSNDAGPAPARAGSEPRLPGARPGPAGLAATRAARLPAPRWLDPRVVAGVLLVLGSVLLGARLVGGADHTTGVLAARHALAPGERLTAADVTIEQVTLGAASSAYLSASAAPPVGYVVTRPVAAGELLPAAALSAPTSAPPIRQVTVPVAAGHLPDGLGRGDVVDVYVTPKSTAGAPTTPRLVAAGVPVDGRGGGARGYLSDSSAVAVVLDVPLAKVADVVAAAETGSVDLVVVPAGSAG